MLDRFFRTALVLCFVVGPALSSSASDGVIEINQACAQSSGGCFPGSPSGFALIVITQPGSYRLTGSLTPVPNASGIVIQASDVTLDLGGFSITGPGSGSGRGIWLDGSAMAPVENVEIRNGTIRGFQYGVWLDGAGVVSVVRVLNVRVLQNELYGLLISGNGSLVRGCTVARNGDVGIRGFPGSSALDNVVFENGGIGMVMNGMAYGRNMVYSNNGGNANPQVSTSGGIQLGPNQCGTAACP